MSRDNLETTGDESGFGELINCDKHKLEGE